jgi:hypothetical protein
MAVGRDHKLGDGNVVLSGKVGHDRIQQASGQQSIGEAIRHWYGLKARRDFEMIEVEATIHPEGHFILVPISVLMRGDKRVQRLEKVHAPLSFHHDHQSKLWKRQIESRRSESESDVVWAASEIKRVVAEHGDAGTSNILEADLLRTAGALSLVGLTLSPYLGKGYDCQDSRFQFSGLPAYSCPVEVKKSSIGLNYQITRYAKLPRAVVLCMKHNIVNPPEHIDFIELPVLGEYLSD